MEKLKSKFDLFGTSLMIAATFLGIGLLATFMVYSWFYNHWDMQLFQRVASTFFLLLVLHFLLIVEIPKIKRIEIDRGGLMLINPFIGTRTNISWDTLDGYKSTTHRTRDGLLRELILVSNGKEIFHISSLYHKNYEEISMLVSRNLRKIAEKDSKWWDYVKRRVFK